MLDLKSGFPIFAPALRVPNGCCRSAWFRWESKKNPDGTWAAYTAIPTGPIAPTNGHMFTNPAVNFGGEHFGVGYNTAVGAIRYQWLVNDGSGHLVHGGAVQVSTPAFTYFPPVGAAPPAVQAVIQPPPPPAPEPKEFGKAVWVKEIRTTTHNNREVKLRNLISDDPEDPNDRNWRNGEPDEVEVEWQILQKNYGKPDAPNNELAAAAEELPNEDEVVTRRYEFYKYTGPLDIETGEAKAQSVAADGIHGVGVKLINGVEVDLSTVEVVGAFTGSQMAAVDGLIDHISDGEVNQPFAARTMVVQGTWGFTSVINGALPAGMEFDTETGVLSGTATGDGAFARGKDVTVSSTPADGFHFVNWTDGGAVTSTSAMGGTTEMDSISYKGGEHAKAKAFPESGWSFENWTESGTIVSTLPSYSFPLLISRTLRADFAAGYTMTVSSSFPPGGSVTGGGGYATGGTVTLTAAAAQTLIGWNNLGMHCMDDDYSVFSILPPYNTVDCQLLDAQGRLVKIPAGIVVTYQAVADPDGSINTTSAGKTKFWQYSPVLFGAPLPPDHGLPFPAGNPGRMMPGAANTPQAMGFDGAMNWFEAAGVPITPVDDSGQNNPYPLMRLTAKTSGGTVLVTTDVVLPVSSEMDCRACHASGSGDAAKPAGGWVNDPDPARDHRMNILRRHDRHLGTQPYDDALAAKGYPPEGLEASVRDHDKPVLCAACQVEFSSDLGHWVPGVKVADAPLLLEVRDPDPAAGQPQRFIRIRASR